MIRYVVRVCGPLNYDWVEVCSYGDYCRAADEFERCRKSDFFKDAEVELLKVENTLLEKKI